MISLKKILNELDVVRDNPDGSIRMGYNNVFALRQALGHAIWVVVISDEAGGGFANSEKRNELFSAIKYYLTGYKSPLRNRKQEVQKIMDGLKYYSATNKIVGNLPKFMFKLGNVPSMRSIFISKEISKISPSIEIKQKK